MTVHCDVAVIGAGLAGSASAAAVARAGYRVALIDDAAGGASAIPVAVMAPYPTLPTDRLTRVRARGARYTAALLDRLEAHGLDSGRYARGVFLLPASERDRRRHRRAQRETGRRIEALTPAQAAQRIGAQVPEAGLLHHGGACVAPERLRQALIQWAGRRVTIERLHVSGIRDGSRCATIYTGEGAAWASVRQVVIAAGAGSVQLWPAVARRLHLVRGQASAWAPSERTVGLRVPISGGGYITPAIDGRQWTGGTAQQGDTDGDVRPQDDRANLARLRTIDHDYPDVEPMDQFVGVRAVTSNRLPLLERLGERVWVNTGHGAHGLMTAPWSGVRLAQALARTR